ncbi:terminase large subunit [Proteiniphilum acetatigenes]|uniref:terminase large subunit n=1 Tax=Proteiniphilum acetatigenes TaxID=294710 RepID=UPI00316AE832
MTANLIGFYWTKDNRRRFTNAYIQVARKNGKSFWAGALSLYFLIADGEPAAEVLLLANSREQAKEVDFKICDTLTKQIDPKSKNLKVYRDSILLNLTNSKLKVLSSESKTGDGYNCSFGLIDEFHEAPDNKMKDLIASSQGMRDNPLLVVITTSGFNKSYPCYKLREVGVEILNKLKEDDSFFISIYELDENDEWDNENNWIKANPSLDITVSRKFLKEQIQKAKNNPSEEVGVKTKNLNIWCDSSEVWIPDFYIIEATESINIDDYKNHSCYLGVDLGATSDLTALSILIPQEDKLLLKVHYYLPESALVEKSLKETYKLWKRLGCLTITPGNVTDYDYITNDIMSIKKTLNIQKIFYDPYNSTQWAIDCTAKGLPLEPYAQNIANFNRPTKELERLILSKKCTIDNNEITRFCFSNVTIKSDHNGNLKPVKYLDSKKIDGVISILMALGGYLTIPKYSNTI